MKVEQEGFLTKARTKLVRGETLAKIAIDSRVSNELVIMDEKGMRNRVEQQPQDFGGCF
jgi:ribonuclease-3